MWLVWTLKFCILLSCEQGLYLIKDGSWLRDLHGLWYMWPLLGLRLRRWMGLWLHWTFKCGSWPIYGEGACISCESWRTAHRVFDSPHRVRHTGDALEFNRKGNILEERRFSADVKKPVKNRLAPRCGTWCLIFPFGFDTSEISSNSSETDHFRSDMYLIRCQGNVEHVSTPTSDRECLISLLRVRCNGDKLEFKWKRSL